ncbi:MAG: outer membrane beta-barrel protein [Bacteroidota bacterium]
MLFEIGLSTYVFDNSFNLPDESFNGSSYLISDLEQQYGGSFNYNLHLFRQRIDLGIREISFQNGLYFEWANYRFQEDISLVADQPTLTVVPDSVDFDRNRLHTTFLKVPLLLQIQTNPRRPSRSFRVAGGIEGGVLLSSALRQKSDERGKERIKDTFNMNQFRASLRAELGFGPINFYANYALTSLFKREEGPELIPFNFGLIIVPF